MNKTPDQSHVTVNAEGRATSFVGADAVNLFRAATLASSLRLYAKTGMIPTRGVTGAAMLKLAVQYTGKKYRRGDHLVAADDVSKWVETMKAALPYVKSDGRPA